jgi:hypothetical protein
MPAIYNPMHKFAIYSKGADSSKKLHPVGETGKVNCMGGGRTYQLREPLKKK